MPSPQVCTIISILQMRKTGAQRNDSRSQGGSMSNVRMPRVCEARPPLALGPAQGRDQEEPKASALSSLQSPAATTVPKQVPPCAPAQGCTLIHATPSNLASPLQIDWRPVDWYPDMAGWRVWVAKNIRQGTLMLSLLTSGKTADQRCPGICPGYTVSMRHS